VSRLPRLTLAGQPHLVLQRGVQGQPVFVDDDDYRFFLARLADAAAACRVAIHAYVLLDSEVRVLATPEDATGLGRMMQSVGRTYVAAFNRRHGRSGTLWQARYRATVLEAESWFVNCMRHVESQPVHVGHPSAVDYPWSSAAHHVGRLASPLVTEHALYWRLGNTPFEREAAYRDLLERSLTSSQSTQIEEATLKGWALGSERFLRELGLQTTRRLAPKPRGRPAKAC
jgi:putative transposase